MYINANPTIELQIYNTIESFSERISYPYYKDKFIKNIRKFIDKKVKDKNLRKILKRDIYLMYQGYSRTEINRFKRFAINELEESDSRPEDILIIYHSISNRLDSALTTMIAKAKARIRSICKIANKKK